MLLAILPLWPTQAWFPQTLRLLTQPLLLLPQHALTLPQDPSHLHPQTHKLVLTAMMLSGNLSQTKAYHQRLRPFSLAHGDTYHEMGVILCREGS